jgi:hypothetical protein
MKRLPLLPLVAVVVALSCRDATSPANSHASLTPGNPSPIVLGDPPPPPVDVAMTISVSSPDLALFTGVYFRNGASIASQVAAAEVGDESIFNGTAWLRLNNKQPDPRGTASANARFKNQDDNLSATGTLTFKEGGVDVVYKITFKEGDFFIPSDDCSVNFQTCAIIKFTAIDANRVEHLGQLTAFNVEGCTLNDDDGLRFICPPPPPPPEG